MTSKMGELNSEGDVLAVEERSDFVSAWKASLPADPSLISEECLSAAEEAAEEVLNCVHPTLDSEEKRRDVIDYVQQLVKTHLNCEVVPYGSVPLKTYLPDGDIDLTILKGPNAEESLPHDVLSLLEAEEQNENAEYQVKDTQFIDAEVKLVKCLVQNIVVDVTFNQLGGLSTLCFLEQVDRLIGRNHVFKRSIILVKTWCYYESRILGAHHGLISTYALETLVLYIFHFFHSSLSGPLSVLYRFLDYYSQFDWENFCISLKGPVHKLSLPDIVVKMPENRCNHLLLSEEFLEKSLELFSVPSRGIDSNPKAFQPKHLNIIDPLKENNNLGRSVHRGNFYRIRSAFKYGAHKLGQILLRPRDEVADVICKFFSNTRARHEHQHRTGTGLRPLEFSDEGSLTASLSSPVELLSDDDMLVKSSVSDFDNNSVSAGHTSTLESRGELDRHSMKEVSPEMASEACDSSDEAFVSVGGKYGLPTSYSNVRNGRPDYLLTNNNGAPFSENHFRKLHYLASRSSAESGSSEDQPIDLPCDSEKFGFNPWLKNREEHVQMSNTFQWCMDNHEAACSCITGSNSTSKASILETPSLDFREIDSASDGGESEAFNPLADLTGDYDSNIRSLLRAQLCHGFALSAASANSSSPPSTIQKIKPWDIVRHSILHEEKELSLMDSHLMPTDNVRYAGIDSTLLGTALHCEGTKKARGLGTYFPDMSAFYMEKSSHWRGRNNPLANQNHHHKYNHSNGIYPAVESKCSVNGIYEVLPARRRHQGLRKRSDVRCQSPSAVGGENQIKGCISTSCRIEFGSVGNLAEEVISSSAHVQCSTLSASMEAQEERVAGKSIHLKNEDEFPPLCLSYNPPFFTMLESQVPRFSSHHED
ncbi:PAP/OAS1 substrate-binding domain superfamily [Perilla frutescens var. hirtella]|nr:PAP/OAS1 substrate-binding domain superfamily [Perilla frutescens var. hirtella]